METTRITDYSKTKQGRFALFSEEGFLFSVDSETFVKYNIGVGSCFCSAELKQLQDASDLRRAKDKALTFLSLRTYASTELYAKLCRNFDEHTAAAAVGEMQRLELLDDEAFVRQRAAYLQTQKKSRREIGMKLAQLGLDRQLIDEALRELPAEDTDTLDLLIERRYAAKLAAGQRDKVAAALLRRGFSGAAVRQAICRFEAGCEEEQD